jgi:heat shock protein HtpX
MIKNQIKTILLLGILSIILIGMGNMIGGFRGLTVMFIFAIAINLISYFFSDKIVLAMYKAKEISKTNHDSRYSKLFKIVEEVSHKAKIPMPRVYIIPTYTPNAFATGRNPKNAAVAATQGIIDLLTEKELEGVIAHEIAHIKNRDILIQTIASIIASMISYLAMSLRYAAIFGGFGGDDRKSNGLELLFLAILTPIAATIVQLSISRSREYLADETGANFLKDGKHLATALEKISNGVKNNPLRFGNNSTASMFITNPFGANGIFFRLLSTHPPVDERIEKLREMKF